MVPTAAWHGHPTLKVAVDLNAAPPLGIGASMSARRRAAPRVRCFGAFGVGNFRRRCTRRA
jgi:hypothetical protein